jgi:molecular chaperone GrpE
MADDNQTIDNVDNVDEPAPAEAAEDLQPALAAAQAKAAEYLEGWQRARAEFANYKRRVEKEQGETQQNATARAVGRFLDVFDDFDRAMQDRPAPEAGPEAFARWADGIGLIQRKLQNVLDAENVERIAAEGTTFDPNVHEAVTHEVSDGHEPGQVIGVIRHGYKIGDRIIRPALVRVAR